VAFGVRKGHHVRPTPGGTELLNPIPIKKLEPHRECKNRTFCTGVCTQNTFAALRGDGGFWCLAVYPDLFGSTLGSALANGARGGGEVCRAKIFMPRADCSDHRGVQKGRRKERMERECRMKHSNQGARGTWQPSMPSEKGV
jgi:hypothetical protein